MKAISIFFFQTMISTFVCIYPGMSQISGMADSISPVVRYVNDDIKSGMGMVLISDIPHSYLYKGEKKQILQYDPFRFEDVNGDSVATSVSSFYAVGSPRIHWASLLPFADGKNKNLQTEILFAPFQAQTSYTNRYQAYIYMLMPQI